MKSICTAAFLLIFSIATIAQEKENGKTKVSVTIYNESLERMEKQIEMGFKEGFTMTLNYLEELLATLSQK